MNMHKMRWSIVAVLMYSVTFGHEVPESQKEWIRKFQVKENRHIPDFEKIQLNAESAPNLEGGYCYIPILDAHQTAREATNYQVWNRVTIKDEGNMVKTWMNGVPLVNWKTERHFRGALAFSCIKPEK